MFSEIRHFGKIFHVHNLIVKETSCFKSRPTYMHTRPRKSAYTKVCSPHYMKYIVHYSEGSNNKCNWAPSLDFSIIKVAWLMCTKRPDNYTLPTMKRETARDMNIKYSKDSNNYCILFVFWPIRPSGQYLKFCTILLKYPIF